MKLKLPRWLTQPTPTPDAPALSTAELVQQLEQRLSEADSEVAAAQAKSQELLIRFSENRTADNLEVQEAAETDLQRLQKLRSLVVADLEAARAKLAAEEHAALVARKLELQEALQDRTRENELTAIEVEKWLLVAEARMDRIAEAQRHSDLESELYRTRLALGETAEPKYGLTGPYSHLLVEPIQNAAKGLPTDGIRHRVLWKLGEIARQS